LVPGIWSKEVETAEEVAEMMRASRGGAGGGGERGAGGEVVLIVPEA